MNPGILGVKAAKLAAEREVSAKPLKNRPLVVQGQKYLEDVTKQFLRKGYSEGCLSGASVSLSQNLSKENL